jgi:Ser/Thr protein kinase RdoA (MazF antagonist)
VTHNDTKLNNVLFDCDTREPLCILDLDTVMPGLSAYDFGDAIRYGAATDREDATENHMDIGLFTQYAKGYLKAVTNLTPQEVDALPMGAFLMTLEVGVRFLTDYLDGDRYFRIAYPQHNLDRAKNQLALAKDIKQKLPLMEEVLHSL